MLEMVNVLEKLAVNSEMMLGVVLSPKVVENKAFLKFHFFKMALMSWKSAEPKKGNKGI